MNATSAEPGKHHRAPQVRTVLVATAILLTLIACTGAAVLISNDVFRCTPPSARALEAQEALVRQQLPDARNIESGTADCDDNGDGYVDFTTDLSPAAARDAFLTDPACSTYVEDGYDIAVTCKTDNGTVYVFFTVLDDTTTGELNLS